MSECANKRCDGGNFVVLAMILSVAILVSTFVILGEIARQPRCKCESQISDFKCQIEKSACDCKFEISELKKLVEKSACKCSEDQEWRACFECWKARNPDCCTCEKVPLPKKTPAIVIQPGDPNKPATVYPLTKNPPAAQKAVAPKRLPPCFMSPPR